MRWKDEAIFYCCRKKSPLRRNLRLFEQKYFPKRFPHKISSEAIKNNHKCCEISPITIFYCYRKKSRLRRNLKLFEQKYFLKRFPHKISSEAIKKWTNSKNALKRWSYILLLSQEISASQKSKALRAEIFPQKISS